MEEKEVKDENIQEEEAKELTKEEELSKKVEELEAEVFNWKKEYSIKLADFENYKKRKDKELAEYKKYAMESLILKQLGSLDILKMAIESAKSNHDVENIIEGLKMLENTMVSYLKEEGLEDIVSEGEQYDPYKHNAVSTVSEEDVENDVVVKELQKGYVLKGKVIRPAMVVINKK